LIVHVDLHDGGGGCALQAWRVGSGTRGAPGGRANRPSKTNGGSNQTNKKAGSTLTLTTTLTPPSIQTQTLTAGPLSLAFTATRLPEDRPVDILWLPSGRGAAGARRTAAVAARLAPAKKAVEDADRARARARAEEVERGRRARTAQVLDRLPSRPGRVVQGGGFGASVAAAAAAAGASRPPSASAAPRPASAGAQQQRRGGGLTPAQVRARMEASMAATAAGAAAGKGPATAPAAKRGRQAKAAASKAKAKAAAPAAAAAQPPTTALPRAALHGASTGSLRAALIGLLASPRRAWTALASIEKALAGLAAAVAGSAAGVSAPPFRPPTRDTLRLALKDVARLVPPGRWVLYDDLRGEADRLVAAAGGEGEGGEEEEEEAGAGPPAKRARRPAAPLPPLLEGLPSSGGGLRRTRSSPRGAPLADGPAFAALCDSYAARHVAYARLHAGLRAKRVEHADLAAAAAAARAGGRAAEAGRLEAAVASLASGADGGPAARAAFEALHAGLAADRDRILDFQARAEEV